MSYPEHFPLVGDEETVTDPPRIMDLYNDDDLISNIQGPYQDRQYTNNPLPDIQMPETSARQEFKVQAQPRQAGEKEKSAGQIAREEAREDLKRKRSAPYLNQNKAFKSKPLPKPQVSHKEVEQAQIGSLTAAADRLRQDDYILAELPQKPQRPKPQVVPANKNSYDFLKTSQIYNYQENRTLKEKKMAQELNLTRFEQKDKL